MKRLRLKIVWWVKNRRCCISRDYEAFSALLGKVDPRTSHRNRNRNRTRNRNTGMMGVVGLARGFLGNVV